MPVRWNGAATPSSSSSAKAPNGEKVTVHFLDPNMDGLPRRMSVKAPVGSTLVDVAKEHGVDIHAACGQKLQCATCHVILEKPYFERLQSPGVREDDLLDSTFTLTDTSRLGCQVRLTKDLDGIQCTLPDSSAKGNVRMTLDMPRPKVQMQLPGAPAVAPSVKRGGAGAAQPNVEELLERQQALSARLEAHLREVRAKAARKVGVTNASDNAGQSAEEEKEDLSKLKAELRATRVEVTQLGRKARFEDVIGLDRAKEAIREAILWPAMASPGLFSGVRSGPKGLLLYGPPGCGKTMLARAAAVELEADASFFHVRPGDVMSKFYGESQRRVQALEEVVREAAPAVVFLDEVDSLLGSRDAGGVAEHHRSTTNALLAWMDGFGTGEERIFFLGATNRAEAIDEAALRRFGEAVEVGSPSLEARIGLVRHLLSKAKLDGHRAELSDQDLQVVGEKMNGFSLADVDRMVRKAFLQVLRELPDLRNVGPADVPPVTLQHFQSAMDASSGTSALREMLRRRADTRSSL